MWRHDICTCSDRNRGDEWFGLDRLSERASLYLGEMSVSVPCVLRSGFALGADQMQNSRANVITQAESERDLRCWQIRQLVVCLECVISRRKGC